MEYGSIAIPPIISGLEIGMSGVVRLPPTWPFVVTQENSLLDSFHQ